MPDFQSKEEMLAYVRLAPEAERWVWLAGEMHDGRARMNTIEEKMHMMPCRRWHDQVLRWLIGTLGGGAVLLVIVYIWTHVTKGA